MMGEFKNGEMTFLFRCHTEEDWDAAQQVLKGEGISWHGRERFKKISYPNRKGQIATLRIVDSYRSDLPTLRHASYNYYQDEFPNHTLLTLHDLETLCVP